MSDDDVERVRRETAEIEAHGAVWAARSDAFLVGYVSQNRHAQFHTPAIVEMQRRQAVATHTFNQQSSAQTADVITLTKNLERLTKRLFWLGVVQLVIAAAVGIIAGLQLWAALHSRAS